MLELDFFRHFLLSRRAGALIRTIAWISMMGVTLGVFALIVVISVMNGFHESIRGRLLAAEPHVVVAGSELSGKVQELLSTRSAAFNSVEKQDVVIRTNDGVFSGAEAKGLDEKALAKLLHDVHEANREGGEKGELSTYAGVVLGPGEVLLGADLARSLGLTYGDKMTLIAPEGLLLPPGEVPRFERVVVKSLLTTNVADLDSRLLIYGKSRSLNALGANVSKRNEVEIWLPSAADAEKVKAEIVKTDTELRVGTWADRNSSLFQALNLEIFAIGLILSLSTMIAGFSIVTVLMILVMQKRKEIGLLMSLGLSRQKTQALFVRVGMMLSGTGVLVGAVSGVLVCFFIDSAKTSILPDFYYDTTIPAKVNPFFVMGVVGLALVLGWLASWAPVRSITALEPAEALRSVTLHRGR